MKQLKFRAFTSMKAGYEKSILCVQTHWDTNTNLGKYVSRGHEDGSTLMGRLINKYIKYFFFLNSVTEKIG